MQTYKERAMRGEFDRSFEFGHGAVGAPRWTINGLHVRQLSITFCSVIEQLVYSPC
jgi:hypothetical protein